MWGWLGLILYLLFEIYRYNRRHIKSVFYEKHRTNLSENFKYEQWGAYFIDILCDEHFKNRCVLAGWLSTIFYGRSHEDLSSESIYRMLYCYHRVIESHILNDNYEDDVYADPIYTRIVQQFERTLGKRFVSNCEDIHDFLEIETTINKYRFLDKVYFFPYVILILCRVMRMGANVVLVSFGFSRHYHKKSGVMYWTKPYGDMSNDGCVKPLIFIHGLGFGVLPYIHFLRCLPKAHYRRLIIIEIPLIAGYDVKLNCDSHLMPTAERFSEGVSEIIETASRSADADFIVHSFGCVLLTYISHYKPEIIGKSVYIDPICFCLNYQHGSMGPFGKGSTISKIKNMITVTNKADFIRHFIIVSLNGLHHVQLICNTSWYCEMNNFAANYLGKDVMVLSGSEDSVLDPYIQRDYFSRKHCDVRFIVKEGWTHGSFAFPCNISETNRMIDSHLY